MEKIPDREKVAQVRSPAELGALFRAERKRRRLTLAQLSEASGLSMRFLSEFERGKDNASVGRVMHALACLGLDVLVVGRAVAHKIGTNP